MRLILDSDYVYAFIYVFISPLLQIWNCESGQLLDILCLNNVNNDQLLVKKETQNSSSISHSKIHPGGITIMKIIDQSR